MNTQTLIGVVVLLIVLGILGYFLVENTEDRHMNETNHYDDHGHMESDGHHDDEHHMNDMHESKEEVQAPENTSVDTQTETTPETQTSSEPEMLEITVEGGNYSYNPDSITVKQGQKVRLTFKSMGGFHDFVIDEIPGAQSERVSAGGTSVIEFTPTKIGSFAYYCSVGSHRALGMEGVLIVE